MVMNIFRKSTFSGFVRKCSSRSQSFQIERLQTRSLIKLTGEDIVTYLQGLITNDVNHFNEDKNALFAPFLNNKGRVLFDTLLYKGRENELLLECDSLIRNDLIKHLSIYRLRKRVNIEPMSDHVWAIFSEINSIDTASNFNNTEKSTICNTPMLDSDLKYKLIESTLRNQNINAFRDPRLYALGVRVFAPESKNIIEAVSEYGINATESTCYTTLRYKLGVPEGTAELPIGKTFPLEANCDYLHGISFHKGCYIGQELTARTHHTGVVRKRMMPLILSSVPDQELEQDSIIVTEDEKIVGKLRGLYENYGIALLRINETLENASKLKLNGISAITYKPFWWPQKLKEDLSKDSAL